MSQLVTRVWDDFQRSLELVIFEVRKTYVQSALGLAWALFEPLLFLATYFFLFAIVLKVPYSGPGGTLGYVLCMFSGLVPWLFFSNCLSRGTSILKSHGPLVKQINFPIYLLPFVTVAQVSVEFLVSMALMVALGASIGLISWATLLLVPATLALAIFLVSVSYLVSCYNILLPDIGRLIPTALRVGMFITPVLYLPSLLPERVRFVAQLNPMSYFISPFRYAFLQTSDVFVLSLEADMLIATAVAAVTAAAAYQHRGFVRRVAVDYL